MKPQILGLYEPAKKPGRYQVGQHFGELTTVRILGTSPQGHVWLLTCDCGRLTVRTLAQLDKRGDAEHSCLICSEELKRGKALVAQKEKAEALQILWDFYGSLYSTTWETHEKMFLREAFGVEEEPVKYFSVEVAEGTKSRTETVQNIYELYPVRSLDGSQYWECEHCKTYVPAALGCIRCTGVVCAACARQELHVHGPEYTYEEIGLEFELTRQQIYQIIIRALKKIRHRWPNKEEGPRVYVEDNKIVRTEPRMTWIEYWVGRAQERFAKTE